MGSCIPLFLAFERQRNPLIARITPRRDEPEPESKTNPSSVPEMTSKSCIRLGKIVSSPPRLLAMQDETKRNDQFLEPEANVCIYMYN